MTNERTVNVVEDLERVLLDFIHKHGITHDEYRAATDLVVSEIKAGEGSLLFDVFLEAAATDVANTGREGSIEAIEGPFYLPDAPWVEGPPFVLPQRPDEPGIPMIFHGRITTEDAEPLASILGNVPLADLQEFPGPRPLRSPRSGGLRPDFRPSRVGGSCEPDGNRVAVVVGGWRAAWIP